MPALALRLHDAEVDFATAVPAFLEACRLRNLSPTTLEWYTYALGPFVTYARASGAETLAAVSPQVVRGFLGEKARQVGPARVNQYTEAIRRLFDWCVAEGYAETNPADRAPKAREGTKLVPTFTEEELRALLRQPDRATFPGLRDHAMMLTLIDTGLRLAELTSLHVRDLDLSDGAAKVLGKGNKERLVGFSPDLARQLRRYLVLRDRTLGRAGVADCPWVFPNQEGRRWHSKGVQDRLRMYGRQAGVTRVRVSPHTFRHTFAVMFVRNGGSAFHLQRILGHSDLTMTRRYCELADTDALDKQRELSPLARMNLAPAPRGRLR